ncbi:MAG: carbohydrate kinase family protein [Rectinemataceae bacterium]
MSIRIAGAGCCLMDILYPKADFSSAAFSAVRSRREGDGGLSPGHLVFAEDAERFTGRPFGDTLAALAESATLAASATLAGADPEAGFWPAAKNIGGPSVVALIHAAQMLEGEGIPVAFHGTTGDDETGRELRDRLIRTPLDASRLEERPGHTPSTFVLSDPTWDGGRGERCFVNDIGAAAGYLPADLGEDFFEADIIALGGTGLVPGLHDGLPGILAEARSRGALTVVNTVFDFRAERRDGIGAWPLGGRAKGPGPKESYRCCDLLVMDRDEALRLSGERDLKAALGFFESSGVGAFAVTRGGESVLAWAGRGRFAPMALREFPVSVRASRERLGPRESSGDTTGCGDAFAGGVIAAGALRLKAGEGDLDLADAVSWGIAAGAFTLGFLGGTYYESRPGEKRERVSSYREDWLAQVGGR